MPVLKKKRSKAPKFKEINLAKCVPDALGTGWVHPQIKIGKQYLAKIDGKLYIGEFDMQWYGLSFDGWEGTSLQLDKPGTNASDWEQLWEIL